MKKTSVYLDDDRDAKLGQVSHLTGRSQSELLREGVDYVIARHLTPRPPMQAPSFDAGFVARDRIDDLMAGFGR